jgi:hypothetical protein
MSHSNLTWWIEAAEARDFSRTAIAERKTAISETQYKHFGDAIVAVPSWMRHGVNREALTAIGCQALCLVRRTLVH